jgi:hypothetical protein
MSKKIKKLYNRRNLTLRSLTDFESINKFEKNVKLRNNQMEVALYTVCPHLIKI